MEYRRPLVDWLIRLALLGLSLLMAMLIGLTLSGAITVHLAAMSFGICLGAGIERAKTRKWRYRDFAEWATFGVAVLGTVFELFLVARLLLDGGNFLLIPGGR